jgi:hypothetical protein
MRLYWGPLTSFSVPWMAGPGMSLDAEGIRDTTAASECSEYAVKRSYIGAQEFASLRNLVIRSCFPIQLAISAIQPPQ